MFKTYVKKNLKHDCMVNQIYSNIKFKKCFEKPLLHEVEDDFG